MIGGARGGVEQRRGSGQRQGSECKIVTSNNGDVWKARKDFGVDATECIINDSKDDDSEGGDSWDRRFRRGWTAVAR